MKNVVMSRVCTASSVVAILSGCFCTTISREYSVPEAENGATLRYEEVKDVASIEKFNAQAIPVVITKTNTVEWVYHWNDHSLLFLVTLGLIPTWDTHEDSHTVRVSSPVGEFEGSCVVTKRTYWGWVPYMLPFSASSQEQKEGCDAELVKRLVEQNKDKWNEETIARLNAANGKRLSELRTKADGLLAGGNWQEVLALCKAEKEERFKKEYSEKADDVRIAEKKKKIESLIAAQDWQTALDLCEEKIDADRREFVSLRGRIRRGKLDAAKDAAAKYDWRKVIDLCEKEYARREVGRNEQENAIRERNKRKKEAQQKLKVLRDRERWSDGKKERRRIRYDIEEQKRTLADLEKPVPVKVDSSYSDDIGKSMCELYDEANEQAGLEAAFDHYGEDRYVRVDEKDVARVKNPAKMIAIATNKKVETRFRLAALARVTDQKILFNIVKSGESKEVSLLAFNAITDQNKLAELVSMDLRWLHGDRDRAKIISRIDPVEAFKDEDEEKVLAFAIRVLELVSTGSTYWYGYEIENDCKCARIAARCASLCGSVDAKAKIIAETLDRFARIEARCANVLDGGWGISQRKEVVSELADLLNDDVIAKILAQNKGGSIWIVDAVSPELAATLIASGSIESKNVEIALALKVEPEKITPELYAAAKSDKGKTILEERMPQNVKKAVRKSRDERRDKLLTKARGNGEDTFLLNGFYLGMPIEDAKELVRYYLPTSVVTITKRNEIEIDVTHGGDFDVTPMYFCRADKDGKVYQLNFDKRFLKKWFTYDVQDHREWAAAFAHEFNCDFRSHSAHKMQSRDMSSIEVSQEYYLYRNNIKGYTIAYYGAKNVSERLYWPTGFSEQAMFYTGLNARLRAWAKIDWDNEIGAREGTLRISRLKEDE